MKKKNLFFLIVLTALSLYSHAQIAVGQWRDHLPYSRGIRVAQLENKVYCSNSQGMFYLNTEDNSVEKLSKVNGLSDIGVSTVAADEGMGVLIVGYNNGNIDLIKDNLITNIPDIKNKQMTGSKTINNILFLGDYAYLSTGFGIVKLDILRKEIKDTYFIGPEGTKIEVFDLTANESNFYAGTSKGIYMADIDNPNLVDYSNWSRLNYIPNYNKTFTSVLSLNEKLYAVYDNGDDYFGDTLYVIGESSWNYFDTTLYSRYFELTSVGNKLLIPAAVKFVIYNTENDSVIVVSNYGGINPNAMHAIIDNNNSEYFWIADNSNGLIHYSTVHYGPQTYYPNSPANNSAFSIAATGNDVWVSAGGINSSWGNYYNTGEIYRLKNDMWSSSYYGETPYGRVRDIVNFEFDPRNNNRVFATTWGYGLMEFENGSLINIYNSTNSSLQSIYPGDYYYRLGGMDYDNNNNLWITNSQVNEPFSVLTSGGQWHSLPYASFFNSNDIGEIIATQNNHKWVMLPRGRGLFVFDEKGTYDDISDDDYKAFSVMDESGAIISNDIYSFAEDRDGVMWIGTNKGAVAYYNPENVFSETDPFYAKKIILQLDGPVNYLLETEIVTAIAIDGANRKWFGTQSAGVFLMSEDCTEQIYNFNTENSPLLSDNILSIAIEPESGEVFFGTTNGIVSFRSTATEPDEFFTEVYAFPNPVKPDYEGDIVIKGLVTNSNVKITDISGNLVYEVNALGGQAIWNGKNFAGERVKTGVYMAFCTNEDGSKTHVTKILFIN